MRPFASGQGEADAREGIRSTDTGCSRAPQQVEAERASGQRFLTVCAWCGRVRVGRRWLQMDEVMRRLDLFGLPEPPQFTHGICPTCIGPLIVRGTAHETSRRNRAA
jgi:hypothetical protein